MPFGNRYYRPRKLSQLTYRAVLISAAFWYLTGSWSAAHADLPTNRHSQSRQLASETRTRLAYYMWYSLPAGSAINLDAESLEDKIDESLGQKFSGQRLARPHENGQDFNLPFRCKAQEDDCDAVKILLTREGKYLDLKLVWHNRQKASNDPHDRFHPPEPLEGCENLGNDTWKIQKCREKIMLEICEKLTQHTHEESAQ